MISLCTENYNKRTHICCENLVRIKSHGENTCCGNRAYNNNTHGCCNYETYAVNQKKKCGHG